LHATRVLDQAREQIRYNYYSLRTEQTYEQLLRMFVKWQDLQHPRDMGQLEIQCFLAIVAERRLWKL